MNSIYLSVIVGSWRSLEWDWDRPIAEHPDLLLCHNTFICSWKMKQNETKCHHTYGSESKKKSIRRFLNSCAHTSVCNVRCCISICASSSLFPKCYDEYFSHICERLHVSFFISGNSVWSLFLSILPIFAEISFIQMEQLSLDRTTQTLKSITHCLNLITATTIEFRSRSKHVAEMLNVFALVSVLGGTHTKNGMHSSNEANIFVTLWKVSNFHPKILSWFISSRQFSNF